MFRPCWRMEGGPVSCPSQSASDSYRPHGAGQRCPLSQHPGSHQRETGRRTQRGRDKSHIPVYPLGIPIPPLLLVLQLLTSTITYQVRGSPQQLGPPRRSVATDRQRRCPRLKLHSIARAGVQAAASPAFPHRFPLSELNLKAARRWIRITACARAPSRETSVLPDSRVYYQVAGRKAP